MTIYPHDFVMRPFFTVLISGAGQLGTRYLQGLASCQLPLRIYVQDVFGPALVQAKERWLEVDGDKTQHVVLFHSSLESLPRQLDVAIVATTAGVRPKVINAIANRIKVEYWILEKILAQNESGLDEILSGVKGSSGAWVNTPRRTMSWHKKIGVQLGLTPPITLNFKGGQWGLACNAVHYLDLFAWWTGTTLQDINLDQLELHWIESKRQDNWEVLGTLEALFSHGGRLFLTSGMEGAYKPLELSDGNQTWLINEMDGTASRSDGIEISGRMSYQSEITSALIESIIKFGKCDLPSLETSEAIHRIFIRKMLEHWKLDGNPSATIVPIT